MVDLPLEPVMPMIGAGQRRRNSCIGEITGMPTTWDRLTTASVASTDCDTPTTSKPSGAGKGRPVTTRPTPGGASAEAAAS